MRGSEITSKPAFTIYCNRGLSFPKRIRNHFDAGAGLFLKAGK